MKTVSYCFNIFLVFNGFWFKKWSAKVSKRIDFPNLKNSIFEGLNFRTSCMTRKTLPNVALFLIFLALTALFVIDRSPAGSGRGWTSVIDSDGRGYYAYLPALILYGDPGFDSSSAAERRVIGNPDYVPEYLVQAGSHTMNKYFAGVALLQSPFFCLATGIALVTGSPVDGYSFVFQLMAGLAALFYLLAGLFFLKKILEYYTSNQAIIAFTLIAFTFGTNLLFYTVHQPLMSHVYSFFAINGFLFFTLRWMQSSVRRNLALSGLFLGIVILVRPVNGIIVALVPFLAGSAGQTRACLKELFRLSSLKAFLLPMLPVLLIQPLLWFLQTGSAGIWPYQHEGFRFLHPEIVSVLFGFRKGLFIYTPLTLLSLSAILFLWRKDKFRSFTALLFFLILTWMIASWWNWYYGDGFGMRPMIEFYGFFAILFVVTAGRLKPARNAIFLVAALLCVMLNMIQTWQYSRHILHPFNMDREKYGYVFLKTGDAYRNSLGGSQDIPWYGTDLSHPCFSYAERQSLLDSATEFGSGPVLQASLLPRLPGRYFISGRFYAKDLEPGAGNKIMMVVSIFKTDSIRDFWYGFPVNDIPVQDTTRYRTVRFALNTPVITNRDALFKIYLWNPAGKKMKAVDFKVDIFAPSAE